MLETVIDTTTGTIMDVIAFDKNEVAYYGSNQIEVEAAVEAPQTGRGTVATYILD